LFPTRTVPTGVSKVLVNATGAQGGTPQSGGLGGLGGWVQASLSVTAGQTLYVFVGGDTVVGASYNGGGAGGRVGGSYAGGGGATDIRTISSDLKSRLIVAGGGGGISGYSSDKGGNGGTVTNSLRFTSCIPKATASDDGVDSRSSQYLSLTLCLQRLVLQEERRENLLACIMIPLHRYLPVAPRHLADCQDSTAITTMIGLMDLFCIELVASA
jgi:Glycine rich protein